jgi:Flp pilus assembly protein TadG
MIGGHSLTFLLRRLRDDRRGAIVAMLAVMTPVIISIIALGIETGIWYTVKRHGQSAADMAAIAAATELRASGTCASATGAAIATACPAAEAVLSSDNLSTFTSSLNSQSELTADYSGSPCPSGDTCVRVILRHQQSATLASLIPTTLTIGNVAVAAIEDSTTQPCVTAFGANTLNSGSPGPGVQLTGNSSISMPNCELVTNSTSTRSIQVNGTGSVDFYSMYSAGNVYLSNNCVSNCTLTYPPAINQPKLTDPYADLTVQTSPADLASTSFAMPALPSSATSFSDPGAVAKPSTCTAASSVQPSYTGGCYSFSSAVTINSAVTIFGSVIFELPKGSALTIAGGGTLTVEAGGTFSLYNNGGGLSVSSGGNLDLLSGANLYVNIGSLAISGCAAIGAGTSTINIQSGNLTSVSGSTIAFNPTGTVCGQTYTEDTTGASIYNIYNGGKGNGVTLAGAATLNIGTYYFTNSNSSGSGLAINGGTAAAPVAFGGGILSVQNGNLAIGSGANVGFGTATTCTATDSAAVFTPSPPAGSCVYIANGGFSNAGTAAFAGNYYLYAPNSAGSISNSGTLTFGGSGTNTYFIDNPHNSFVNTGSASFGTGNVFIFDGGGSTGSSPGGFENAGTLNLCNSSCTGGSSESNYYFLNGTSYGTSPGGSCVGSSSVFGALSLMAGSTANFGPGNYYLVNGDLCIHQNTSNATEPIVDCVGCALDSAGVTFILTGTVAADIGTLQIPAPIDTTADPFYPNVSPSPYAGLLVYQDRNAAIDTFTGSTNAVGTCGTNCNQIQAGSDLNLTGAIYMPRAELSYQAQGSASAGDCLLLLVDSLNFTGGASLSSSGCDAAGVTNTKITFVALIQ